MAEAFNIADIAKQFQIDGEFLHSDENGDGLINITYIVTYDQEGVKKRYVIQRINDFVFPDPVAVMRNVEAVTQHIAAKSDGDDRVLRLFPAKSGESFVRLEDGGVWRCYNFIEGCKTYDVVENTTQAYQAAYAFGEFQNALSDLSADDLVETIPDFHETPKRYERLMEVVAADQLGRLAGVTAELEFIKSRGADVSRLTALRDAGQIPVRITHNDTKFNNVMIDAQTDEAVCVIDLDTVMPGLSLYDFGDLVRTAVNPAEEGSTNLSDVAMRMPIFQALVDGYLSACTCLNQTEKDHLAFSGKLITLELAIRFLTDYLEGDVYFKTEREGQNLDRTRMQLELVTKIEEEEAAMAEYVRCWGSEHAFY